MISLRQRANDVRAMLDFMLSEHDAETRDLVTQIDRLKAALAAMRDERDAARDAVDLLLPVARAGVRHTPECLAAMELTQQCACGYDAREAPILRAIDRMKGTTNG
jgi:hypothetical protein